MLLVLPAPPGQVVPMVQQVPLDQLGLVVLQVHKDRQAQPVLQVHPVHLGLPDPKVPQGRQDQPDLAVRLVRIQPSQAQQDRPALLERQVHKEQRV